MKQKINGEQFHHKEKIFSNRIRDRQGLVCFFILSNYTIVYIYMWKQICFIKHIIVLHKLCIKIKFGNNSLFILICLKVFLKEEWYVKDDKDLFLRGWGFF